MIRKAFLMTLKPGAQSEYERRHRFIWPELASVLKQHGVRNYSIFLDRKTDRLFAYPEIESEGQWHRIAQNEICQQWWLHMSELMLTHDDNRPVTTELKEVFHVD